MNVENNSARGNDNSARVMAMAMIINVVNNMRTRSECRE